jgi:23S rRNA (cytosine1962-C5)-methyltransferase
VLKPGREKPVLQRHPWIFSGAVRTVGEEVTDGEPAEVVGADGRFLARGLVNRRSQIVVRLFTWAEDEPIDVRLFQSRVRAAVSRRGARVAERLVHGESDGLPGLVADRYGDYCVIQASTLGVDRRKAEIVQAILGIVPSKGVWDRSDVDGRGKEGLEPATGLLAGDEPPAILELPERTDSGGQVVLLVDVRRGHKTGAYLDQSENSPTPAPSGSTPPPRGPRR